MSQIICGILIASAFATICNIISSYSKKHEDEWIIIGGGFFSWILYGALFILESFCKDIKFHNLKSVLKCPDGKLRYISYKLVDGFIYLHNGYCFANYKDLLDEYDKKLWNKEYRNFDGSVNVRYCPKKVWKNYEQIKED